MIIHGLTNMLANPTPNASGRFNPDGQRSKIHLKGLRRALGHTRVAALPGCTDPLGNDGDAKVDATEVADGAKGLWFAGGDTRKILTKVTGPFVRIDDRGLPSLRAVGIVGVFEDADAVVRARVNTFSAARTTLKKQGFLKRARRPQPIGSSFFRLFLMDVFRVPVLDVLMHGHTQGNNALFEKIPAPVGRLRMLGGPRRRLCHAPALALNDACGTKPVDLYAAVAGTVLNVPSRMIFPDVIQYVGFNFFVKILDPGIGGK